MNIAKHLKILFLLAGIILSAKPLIGFGVIHHAREAESKPSYSLLRELFSRRKPDSLSEGLDKIATLHQKLKDAGLAYTLTLFGLIFGLVSLWAPRLTETKRYLLELQLLLVPEDNIYLSIGKLTI